MRGFVWFNWKAGGDVQSPVPGVKMVWTPSVGVEISTYVSRLDEPVYV